MRPYARERFSSEVRLTPAAVALHAIAAFGSDCSPSLIHTLATSLLSGDARQSAACSAVLQRIGGSAVIRELAAAAGNGHPQRHWVVATLGRLPGHLVRAALEGTALLTELEPMLLYSGADNWLASEETQIDLATLLKQVL